MTLLFYAVASGNGVIVNCRKSACHIFCDGNTGCKGLKIYVTKDSSPKLTINSSDCINSLNWDQKIDAWYSMSIIFFVVFLCDLVVS